MPHCAIYPHHSILSTLDDDGAALNYTHQFQFVCFFLTRATDASHGEGWKVLGGWYIVLFHCSSLAEHTNGSQHTIITLI